MRTVDRQVERALTRLRRAAAFQHSGRSFAEHLIGTWRLLTLWGAPRHVCRAGLVHSAYATEYYPLALFRFADRPDVRRLIGRDAETLAYLFCVLERPALWRAASCLTAGESIAVPRRDRPTVVRLSRRQILSLITIEAANLAEQSSGPHGSPGVWLAQVSAWLSMCGEVAPAFSGLGRPLSAVNEQKALEAYHRAFNSTCAARAEPWLAAAVNRNHLVGEPLISAAVIALQRGRHEAAMTLAAAGQCRLARWNTAWDKRLGVADWLGIADAVFRCAERRIPGPELSWARLVDRVTRPDVAPSLP